MGRLRGDQFHSITEEFVGGEHGVVGEGIHLVRVTPPPPSTQLIPTSHEKKLLAAVGHWRGRLLRVAGDRANDGWRLTCDPQRNQCLVKKKKNLQETHCRLGPVFTHRQSEQDEAGGFLSW